MSAAPPALLSIHDVMPETLEPVARLLERVAAAGLAAPALLVVPGRDWQPAGLRRLRAWHDAGCELLAHGWLHHTRPRRLVHRCHAALLSRNVAEHLALDERGIRELMQRSHDWFEGAGLPPPRSYVPPAWALGMPARQLAALPYDCVETLGGVHLRGGDGRWSYRSLPLVGFEADTPLRAAFLRFFNGLQRASAARRQRPLRIGIHPQDAGLRLAGDLDALLTAPWGCRRYADLGRDLQVN